LRVGQRLSCFFYRHELEPGILHQLQGRGQARAATFIRDRQRLYRDRTCIVALEEFLERAARGTSA